MHGFAAALEVAPCVESVVRWTFPASAIHS
jgi:hypothetical protein